VLQGAGDFCKVEIEMTSGQTAPTPFAKRLLQAGVETAKHVLPARVRASLRERWTNWQRNQRVSKSPDRAVLTETIFPALARSQVFARGADVLWIGCRGYTKKYYRLIEAGGARCWTLDIDPNASRWGRSGRHIVGGMLESDVLFPDVRFDAVLCNGVLGWGVNAPSEQSRAYSAMASVTKPRGWLLVGWNTDRISDPMKATDANRWFEPACLPGFGARMVVEGCTHVFDLCRRRSDTIGSGP